MAAGKIRINREGDWEVDGALVTRPAILRLLAEHLERKDTGFGVCQGVTWLPVAVEDVPFLVSSVLAGTTLMLQLKDGRVLPLPAMGIQLKLGIPYTSLRWPGDTRFSRAAFWQLQRYFLAQDGKLAVVYGNQTWSINEQE